MRSNKFPPRNLPFGSLIVEASLSDPKVKAPIAHSSPNRASRKTGFTKKEALMTFFCIEALSPISIDRFSPAKSKESEVNCILPKRLSQSKRA
jgi:hypothetical protein